MNNDPDAIEMGDDTGIEKSAERIDRRTREGRAAAAGLGTSPPRTRGATRQASRDSTRGEVIGRNGEVLSRSRKQGVDPFEIPSEIIPENWTYQWNVISVTGNADVCLDQGMGMYENGWRPVPAERHPGRFVPHGTRGEIVRGGQRLEERPLVLTEEAKAADVRTAKQLLSDRNDSLKLSGVKNAMPDGFAMNQRYRGTGGQIKMDIDPALDIPQPQHTLAGPDE